MKKLLALSVLMIVLQGAVAQKIDTIFYDSNWKGVPVKSLATYMRVIYEAPKGSMYSNVGRDYFTTGELHAEGGFTYIDRYDDSKSRWKGKYVRYYKTGKKEAEGFNNDSSKYEGKQYEYYESGTLKRTANFNNGMVNGELYEFHENGKPSELSTFSNGKIQSSTVYYDNGNIKSKANFLGEKLNGTIFQYFEDNNSWIEIEMADGREVNNYVTYVDTNGNRTKYDKDLKNIIQEIPTPIDRKKTVSNGAQFLYYQMNGIFLAVNLRNSDEVGKYYVASIVLGNKSNQSVTFETEKLTCNVTKGDKTNNCKVYSSDEYSAIVGKKLRSRSFWNALSESFAAGSAGISTTSTASISAGYANSAAIGADNNGNIAVGVGSTYGANSTYTQTNNYNGAAQYQANQVARQNIAQYDNQLQQYQQSLDAGYLKSNVVEAGKSIIGNVNIKFQKGDKVTLCIPINGSVYPFEWNFTK